MKRIVIALYLMAASVGAQDTTRQNLFAELEGKEPRDRPRSGTVNMPLAERSYILRNIPNKKTNEIFEGLLALHFPFVSTLQSSYDTAYQRPGRRSGAWTFSFSMLSNVRMTYEHSVPVRTPSYMPRLRLQRVSTLRDATSKLHVRQRIIDGIVGHYSNGQDGCLFDGQTSNGTDCSFATQPAERDLAANRKDGSFSANYYDVGFTWRFIELDPAIFERNYSYSRNVWSIGVKYRDYRFLSFAPGGLSKELRDVYGAQRVRLSGSYTHETNDTERFSGRLWVDGFAEALPGAAEHLSPVRFAVEVGRSFDSMQGTGFFARYYRGQDDYNLGFLHQISVLQLGLVLGGESRLAFRR